MSEWLTTGQMLDILKEGEIAEYKTKYGNGFVKKIGETIVYCEIDGEEIMKDEITFKTVVLDKGIVNAKWRIIHKYVSFEEAMKALMNWKIVWLWKDGKKRTGYYIDKENGKLWSIVGELAGQVDEIQFGDKWIIED